MCTCLSDVIGSPGGSSIVVVARRRRPRRRGALLVSAGHRNRRPTRTASRPARGVPGTGASTTASAATWWFAPRRVGVSSSLARLPASATSWSDWRTVGATRTANSSRRRSSVARSCSSARRSVGRPDRSSSGCGSETTTPTRPDSSVSSAAARASSRSTALPNGGRRRPAPDVGRAMRRRDRTRSVRSSVSVVVGLR